MTPDEKAGAKALKRQMPPMSGRQWKKLRKALQRADTAVRAAREAQP